MIPITYQLYEYHFQHCIVNRDCQGDWFDNALKCREIIIIKITRSPESVTTTFSRRNRVCVML